MLATGEPVYSSADLGAMFTTPHLGRLLHPHVSATDGALLHRRDRQSCKRPQQSVSNANSVFQAHCVDAEGKAVIRRQLKRCYASAAPSEAMLLPAKLSPAPVVTREFISKLITRKYLCQNQLCAAENRPIVNFNPSFI
jgi:hypothetical protein